MAVLQPFRAFRSTRPAIYVPGEEPPRPYAESDLVQDREAALFMYRQSFRFPGEGEESVRMGVMGILNRNGATVLPHEEVFPERVVACKEAVDSGSSDLGSLWLWCEDRDGGLQMLLRPEGDADLQALDRFGCLHELWPVTDAQRIEWLQSALAGRDLFIADGHHRFAAGWNLATIQIKTEALRTRPSHRLVIEKIDFNFDETKPICLEEVDGYLATGHRRCVLVQPGPLFHPVELPHDVQAQKLFGGARLEAVRDAEEAISAVQAGRAAMALLMAAVLIEQIELDALRGTLLPPKSTDFYPKLAAGLVIHRH